jgi:hypothetical protein
MVDSASIAIDRRARRAKTDRIRRRMIVRADGPKRGKPRIWAIIVPPSKRSGPVVHPLLLLSEAAAAGAGHNARDVGFPRVQETPQPCFIVGRHGFVD